MRHLSSLLADHGLSLAVGLLFFLSVAGQFAAGHAAHNEELAEHGRPEMSFRDYVGSGHSLEALFENWESEFLQMGLFVLLAAKLRQKGSAESRKEHAEEEAEEQEAMRSGIVPWPVRRGGLWLRLYEHSLSAALLLLFALSFLLHGIHGLRAANAEALSHGQPAQTLLDYFRSSRFWFESLQNWQSEFFAVLTLVLLSIVLREKGSSQSKPVAAPHARTGSS